MVAGETVFMRREAFGLARGAAVEIMRAGVTPYLGERVFHVRPVAGGTDFTARPEYFVTESERDALAERAASVRLHDSLTARAMIDGSITDTYDSRGAQADYLSESAAYAAEGYDSDR